MLITRFLLTTLLLLVCLVSYGQDTIRKTPSHSEEDSVRFYGKLQKISTKSKFLRLLYDALIVVPHTADTVIPKSGSSDCEYECFEGKIVRKIKIRVLDVFGTTIHHPDTKTTNILERFGNSVHIETRPFIVKNLLLISEHKVVSSWLFYESERLLRRQKYILDARLIPMAVGTDSVDVEVIVQDVWSITPYLMLDPFMPQGFIELEDINFLGTGQTGSYRFQFRNDSVFFIRNAGRYFVPNIKGTYIDGGFQFRYDENVRMAEINFKRPFFSPLTRTAYGLTLNRTNNLSEIWSNERLIERKFLAGSTFDAWLARSFQVVSEKNPLLQKMKWVTGLRLRYFNADVLENRVSNYYNSYLWLGESGFSYRNYYKDRLLYRYGRTEDVAEGLLAKIIYGVELSGYNPRFYFGTLIRGGKHFTRFGYLGAEIGIGQYVQRNKIYDGSLFSKWYYFTDLIETGRWKSRFFTQLNFTKALSIAQDRFVYLNNEDGLRAFDNPFLRGKDKLVTKFQIILFSPYRLVGFRFAGILFTDLALLSDFQRPIYKSQLYKSFGFGITFRNDRLIFQTLEIVFSFTPSFPLIPQKPIRSWDVYFDLHQPITTDVFFFDKPEVIPYR